MLEKFPKLNESEVALSRAEANTGIVLDEQFKYALSPAQKIYTVLNNVDDALKLANEILINKAGIEIYIHDKEEKLLHLLILSNVTCKGHCVS